MTVEPIGGDRLIAVKDNHYGFGDVSVWHGQSPTGLDIIPQSENDAFVIFLPMSGAIEVAVGKRNVLADPENCFIGDGRHFSKLRLHRDRSHLGLALKRDAVAKSLSDLLDCSLTRQLDFKATFSLSDASGATLFSLAKALYEGSENQVLQSAPIATSHLSEAIVSLIVEAIPHNYSAALSNNPPSLAPRQIRRAIEFMRENADKPLTVSEIALASGASVRSLQLNFARFKDASPWEYLTRIRLEKARSELMSDESGSNIRDVASKWGFSHFGHFSLKYRRAFGELPSATKKGRG